MMKKIGGAMMVAFVLALIVGPIVSMSGCSDSEKLKATRNDPTFQMTIHPTSENEIQAVCQRLGVDGHANGCAAFDLGKKTCDIYVMPLRTANDDERMKIIGHETWHCMTGRFHD